VTLRILHYLIEIERRKLHLLLGHSSMFDYCTRGLDYSVLRPDAPVHAGASSVAGMTAACEKSAYCRSGSDAIPAEMPASREHRNNRAEPELHTRLSFTVGEPFMANLERVKELAWHRLGANPSLEQVFVLTMDLFLKKNDPIGRRARRNQRNRAAYDRSAAIPI